MNIYSRDLWALFSPTKIMWELSLVESKGMKASDQWQKDRSLIFDSLRVLKLYRFSGVRLLLTAPHSSVDLFLQLCERVGLFVDLSLASLERRTVTNYIKKYGYHTLIHGFALPENVEGGIAQSQFQHLSEALHVMRQYTKKPIIFTHNDDIVARPLRDARSWYEIIQREKRPQRRILNYSLSTLPEVWVYPVVPKNIKSASLHGADFWLSCHRLGIDWPLEQLRTFARGF